MKFPPRRKKFPPRRKNFTLYDVRRRMFTLPRYQGPQLGSQESKQRNTRSVVASMFENDFSMEKLTRWQQLRMLRSVAAPLKSASIVKKQQQ